MCIHICTYRCVIAETLTGANLRICTEIFYALEIMSKLAGAMVRCAFIRANTSCCSCKYIVLFILDAPSLCKNVLAVLVRVCVCDCVGVGVCVQVCLCVCGGKVHS